MLFLLKRYLMCRSNLALNPNEQNKINQSNLAKVPAKSHLFDRTISVFFLYSPILNSKQKVSGVLLGAASVAPPISQTLPKNCEDRTNMHTMKIARVKGNTGVWCKSTACTKCSTIKKNQYIWYISYIIGRIITTGTYYCTSSDYLETEEDTARDLYGKKYNLIIKSSHVGQSWLDIAIHHIS